MQVACGILVNFVAQALHHLFRARELIGRHCTHQGQVLMMNILWQIKKERCHILSSEKCVMKAGFVSFNSRWGAAVCAQTQQSKDSTCWLTDWAPEARDVCWDNLSIPYMELNSRRLLIGFIIFFIASFFMIPITFVQSLANLDALDKNFHFLKPLLDQ
jgi:hypothetical protein